MRERVREAEGTKVWKEADEREKGTEMFSGSKWWECLEVGLTKEKIEGGK